MFCGFAQRIPDEDHPTETSLKVLALKALANSSPEVVATLGFKLEGGKR
jgi:hypothetical protein